MSQNPHEGEYSEPKKYPLCCTNSHCKYYGLEVRELNSNLHGKYGVEFYWLCPKCFKKLVILEKEKVEFG